MKTNEVTEDGIYIFHAGRFVTVWVRTTRLDEKNNSVGVWRDVMDWTGRPYLDADLTAYNVSGKLKLGQPYSTVEKYVT